VGGQKDVPALRVPRQCPFVLLVEIRLTEGKALGSELSYELRKQDDRALLHMVGILILRFRKYNVEFGISWNYV
jgi:hypothetical protein